MATARELAYAVKRIAERIRQGDVIERVRPIVHRAVQHEAPVRTGRLRREVYARREGRNRIVVGSAAPYTKYVVRGRGPVVARPGKVLRFTIGGTVLFRKRVGPAKANNFIDRGGRRALWEIERELGRVGVELLGEVAR